MSKTKEVDNALRETWAKLATKAAARAARDADAANFCEAEDAMEYVEKWLNNAGARATRWSFRQPS